MSVGYNLRELQENINKDVVAHPQSQQGMMQQRSIDEVLFSKKQDEFPSLELIKFTPITLKFNYFS